MKMWSIIKIILFIFIFIVGSIYINFFQDALDEGRSRNVSGYTRFLLEDTFGYKEVVSEDKSIGAILQSEIKNTIGPSILWYLAYNNWYVVLAINVLICAFIVILIESIGHFLLINKKSIKILVLVFLLSPSTLYYCIGASKELPMALILLLLTYNYYVGNKISTILSTLFLIVFRHQMIVLFFLIALVSKFKKIILTTFALVILVSMLYPMISTFGMLYSYENSLYRELGGLQDSIGAYIEGGREIYIVSAPVILIRTMQTILEPFVTYIRYPSFYEEGFLNIYLLAQFLTLIFFFPYLIKFITKCIFLLMHDPLQDKKLSIIFGFALASIIIIGGFSFIHHRYLYPFFPLIGLLSLVSINRGYLKNNE